MARLLLDDGFAQHPKVVALGYRDRWTWLELLMYCARYRTGGLVPKHTARVVRGAGPAFIARVFELGLLDEAEGEGWLVHDWGIYNGATITERVESYLRKRPNASANEVAREVSGRRDVVLSEVARIRRESGREAESGGSADTDANGTAGTQDSGSESGSPAGALGRVFGPVPVTKGQAVALDVGRTAQKAPSAERGDGPLAVAEVCPVCGPLHSVPLGFDMADHLGANVHGLAGEELAAALERYHAQRG